MTRRRTEPMSAWEIGQRTGLPAGEVAQFLDDLARTRGRWAVWTIDERCRPEVLREWWGDDL
jgi:uncharacterized membrane protein